MGCVLARLGLAALLACVACVPAPQPGFESNVAPRQTAGGTGSPRGIVVLGLVLSQHSRSTLLVRKRKNWAVAWRRLDDSGQIQAGGPAILARRGTACTAIVIEPTGCNPDHSVVEYAVFAVPPGTYMLEKVQHADFTTPFTTPPDSPLFERDAPSNKARGDVPWFEVGAGEVVYIGDFVFDITGKVARLVEIRRDDAAAAEALARYPKVEGRPRFRAVAGARTVN